MDRAITAAGNHASTGRAMRQATNAMRRKVESSLSLNCWYPCKLPVRPQGACGGRDAKVQPPACRSRDRHIGACIRSCRECRRLDAAFRQQVAAFRDHTRGRLQNHRFAGPAGPVMLPLTALASPAHIRRSTQDAPGSPPVARIKVSRLGQHGRLGYMSSRNRAGIAAPGLTPRRTGPSHHTPARRSHYCPLEVVTGSKELLSSAPTR